MFTPFRCSWNSVYLHKKMSRGKVRNLSSQDKCKQEDCRSPHVENLGMLLPSKMYRLSDIVCKFDTMDNKFEMIIKIQNFNLYMLMVQYIRSHANDCF